MFSAVEEIEDGCFNVADQAGSTALSRAIRNGQEGVVGMLLEQEGVNPNQADNESGWTPLMWAAILGHEGVVKVLSERGDVNPDGTDDECGVTPLMWAATYGNEGVVRCFWNEMTSIPTM